MGTEIVKSAAITSRNSSPPVRVTSGKGGDYVPVIVDATVAIASGITVGTSSYYRLVRIPKNAMVKKVEAWLDAASTTITGDIGLYYSDDARDENAITRGRAGTIINADHFASAVVLAAIVTPTEYTFEAGTFLGADTRAEVWAASGGISSDPGPTMFDVVFTPTSTTGAAAVLNVRVTYALPNT